MAKRHKCKKCGAYMYINGVYTDHVNLCCPQCGYRDTYPDISPLKSKPKKKETTKRGD